jgi:hypothetical protein
VDECEQVAPRTTGIGEDNAKDRVGGDGGVDGVASGGHRGDRSL